MTLPSTNERCQELQRIGPSGPVGEADKERKNQPGAEWACSYPRDLQAPFVILAE